MSKTTEELMITLSEANASLEIQVNKIKEDIISFGEFVNELTQKIKKED